MPTLKRLGALSLSLVLALTAFTGCGAKGGSSSSSSDGSSSQVQAMDLSSVTDPFLSTAGLSGDTVVATVGDTEITPCRPPLCTLWSLSSPSRRDCLSLTSPLRPSSRP